MRLPLRNLRTIHYKTYLGKTEILEDGLRTGEYKTNYSDLVELVGDVSASRGSADLDMFGINTPYTKVLLTTWMECPINEQSIIWIDAPTTGQHDYVVVQVAKSFNVIAIALREVSKDES